MGDNEQRTLADINEMLHLAKLSEEDISPKSQVLYFSENAKDSNYVFLELDKHLLEEVQEGKTLFIKGDDDENAVLCTQNRTYDLNLTETSNSLLLMKNLKFFDHLKDDSERGFTKTTVSGVFYEYLEATPGKPYLKKLTQLLNKSLYKGPEHEFEVESEDLFSYEDLLEKIQSSEEELRQSIGCLVTVRINNKIRLLDFEYHFRSLSYMLKLIEENSWALDQIDFDETINSLKEIVPEEVLTGLFETYTRESRMIDGVQLYSYKGDLVCKFFAQVLLYGAGKFNLEDFLQAWRESVPEGMVPGEDLLYGIAIVDRKCHPNTIRAFPEEDLPEQVNRRFDALFEAKEKWTVPEITPYIQRLATDKLDVNAILTKHARASKVDGVKYYSAKHGK